MVVCIYLRDQVLPADYFGAAEARIIGHLLYIDETTKASEIRTIQILYLLRYNPKKLV